MSFNSSRVRTLMILLLFPLLSIAQNSCSNRYLEKTFSSIQIFRDVTFTQNAPTLLSATPGIETTYNKDLKMDIFMPPPTDTVSARPLVILAHGGGFINVLFMGGTVLVGTKNNDDVQALADSLAHWGYVTASIEYRTGFDILSGTSLKRAIWRGAQDMSAAIRFFRKNATWFDIDPNRLFIAGSSAGAFCAIHSTFIDDSERFSESFQQIPILMQDLGSLHSRPVVELTGFNPFSGNNVLGNDVDSIAEGIAAYWGAIVDTDMFLGNNTSPMIMFHGRNDLIVDPECGQPFSNVILTAPVTCGTIAMDSVMMVNGLPHETHLAQGENHEYWGVLNGVWLPTGPNAYWVPIIDETADYFYKIMQPVVPTINGPLAVAPNTIYSYSVANPVMNSSYCWEIDGGTIVSSNPTGSAVDVLFYSTTTMGAVKCEEVDAADVSSQQRNQLVNVSTLLDNNLIEENNLINVYPNPTKDLVNIDFGPRLEEAILELYSIEGQLLTSWNNIKSSSQQIDLSTFNSGLYLLLVRVEGKGTQGFKISKI